MSPPSDPSFDSPDSLNTPILEREGAPSVVWSGVAAEESAVQQLAAACRLPRGLRLHVGRRDRDVTSSFPLQTPFVVVGSDESAHLQLRDSKISRRHALLLVVGRRLLLCDIARHFACLGEEERPSQNWGNLATPIEIGPYKLTLSCDDAGAEPLGDSSALLPTTIRFLGSPERARTWPLTREVTLFGSGSPCHARLTHPTMSRLHACLVRTSSEAWLLDVGSRTGMIVEGERVPLIRLQDGARFQMGTYQMQVELGTPVAPPPQPAAPPTPLATMPSAASLSPAELPTSAEIPASRVPIPTQGGVSEEFVLKLIRQVADMQERMVEQSRQTNAQLVQLLERLIRERTGMAPQATARTPSDSAAATRSATATGAAPSVGGAGDSLPGIRDQLIQSRTNVPTSTASPHASSFAR